MSSSSTNEFNTALLLEQAQYMRGELVKATEQVKHIPQVEQALAYYDEQMYKLTHPLDWESAKRVFDLLVVAKDALIKVIEFTQNSPIGMAILARLGEYQSRPEVQSVLNKFAEAEQRGDSRIEAFKVKQAV